ncbi:MAG: TetR/AcrR family transcriptional regulator [Acidimicrobiia bacterium]
MVPATPHAESTSIPTRRQVAAAERRAQILAASRKVFLARGLAGARTRQIAEEAGVKEAILYSHFASKEDIFAAAVFDPLEELVNEIVERVNLIGGANAQAGQRVFLEENRKALEVMQEVVPLLGVALFSNVAIGRRFFVERLAPLLEHWAQVTENAMEGWAHRPIDPRIVMISAWGMHFGLALDAAMRDKELDTVKTTKEISDLLYYGLAHTPKSRSKSPSA